MPQASRAFGGIMAEARIFPRLCTIAAEGVELPDLKTAGMVGNELKRV
jgi:hypothetical protein